MIVTREDSAHKEKGPRRPVNADALQAKDAEIAILRASIATAYGYLRHVNNEPGTPAAIYPPERAAYAARMVLRVLLTDEQRGKGINEARATMNAAIDAARGTTPDETLTEIDGCSEENCRRCRTAPNLRGNMAHAGIGSYPSAMGKT